MRVSALHDVKIEPTLDNKQSCFRALIDIEGAFIDILYLYQSTFIGIDNIKCPKSLRGWIIAILSKRVVHIELDSYR